jgi:hypothetical protein
MPGPTRVAKKRAKKKKKTKYSMALGRKAAAQSRKRTPGWNPGSEQDRIQRLEKGHIAAREMTNATMEKNRAKKKAKKKAKAKRRK